MNILIKKCFISFFLTIGIGFLLVLLSSLDNTEHIAYTIIVMPIFGLLNIIFLLLIHFSGLSKAILINNKLLFIEIILLYIIYEGIVKFLEQLPNRFDVTPTEESVKFYLLSPFDFIYTFLILTVLIFIFRKALTKLYPIN